MANFTAQCPTCSAKVIVPNEELIGKKTRCKKCSGVMVLKPIDEEIEESEDGSITDEIRALQPMGGRRHREPVKKDSAASKSKKKPKSASKEDSDKRVLIISLVATIVVVLVVGMLIAAIVFLPHLFFPEEGLEEGEEEVSIQQMLFQDDSLINVS
ncbi:MAG: hypothetical protein R3C11_21180 [Planctomycetaceae bacterium]